MIIYMLLYFHFLCCFKKLKKDTDIDIAIMSQGYEVTNVEVCKGNVRVHIQSNERKMVVESGLVYNEPTPNDLINSHSQNVMWVNTCVLPMFSGDACGNRPIEQWEMDRHLAKMGDTKHANAFVYNAWLDGQNGL